MERAIAIIVILAVLALVGLALFGPKPQSSANVPKEAQFTLTEYAITPNQVSLQRGLVKLVFVNRGKIVHQIEIYDPVEKRAIAKLDMIGSGTTETLWIELAGGRRYFVYDPVWRKRGMEAVITAQ